MAEASTHVPPYRDPALSVAARVSDLLGRMTLAEKVGQMLQLDARQDLDDAISHRGAGSILHASPELMIKAIELSRKTRLQIPLLTGDDAIHGHSFWPGATIFPTQLAMACSWDVELLERVARCTAVEVAATGLHWTFSPVLCIARDLRWGRVDETFGEDPYLIGELGAAMVRGYQGDGLTDPTAVLACAKHFAGYSQTHGGRDASEADLSHRALRSWFLPPFERAVKEGCRTVMLGYQAIDGVPVTANSWLLDEVLRGEWGFTGTLVTDWDNVGRMVWEQKISADDAQAAARAVNAGNHLIMTTPQFFEGAQQAVADGTLAESRIDEAVERILRLKFELGLFEDPRAPHEGTQQQVIGSPAHTAVNLEASRRSLVLLRNDGYLPLEGGFAADEATGAVVSRGPRTVAVLGPNADDVHAQLGDWAGASGQVPWMPEGHPRALTLTVLDGLRALAPEDWTLQHVPGAEIGHLRPDPEGPTYPDGQPRPDLFTAAVPDAAEIDRAVQAALSADMAVVVLGDTVALTGEMKSTATLELQGGQIALLDALAAARARYALVLVHSKPAVLPPSADAAAAIIEAFNPGMQGGRAVAELLVGLIEPSGRLPISVPLHVGQQPVYYNQIRGQHGHRYADLTQEPAFVFGQGLSYSTVTYDDLVLASASVTADGVLRGHVTVRNTGDRPVLETVQFYVSDLVTSVTWAEMELKGFLQVHLQPSEQRLVPIELSAADLTLVDASERRITEPGTFELRVGPSSRRSEHLTATFEVTAPS